MSNEANAIVIEQPVINEDNTITFRVDEAKVEENPDALKTWFLPSLFLIRLLLL